MEVENWRTGRGRDREFQAAVRGLSSSSQAVADGPRPATWSGDLPSECPVSPHYPSGATLR